MNDRLQHTVDGSCFGRRGLHCRFAGWALAIVARHIDRNIFLYRNSVTDQCSTKQASAWVYVSHQVLRCAKVLDEPRCFGGSGSTTTFG